MQSDTKRLDTIYKSSLTDSSALRKGILARSRFLEIFIISQTAFPALLYLPGTQPFRIPIRVSSFGLSLAALAWCLYQHRKKDTLHPAVKWLVIVMIWLGLMVFHPTTNTIVAGIAQTMLYLAIMAPVFWVPKLIESPTQLKRLLWILLICNGVNSLVGVLQVYDPVQWLPREFSSIQTADKGYFDSLTYINDQGQIIVRPPGLGDSPGAVSIAGMLAATLAMFFMVGKIKKWKLLFLVAISIIGLAVIYLSQVRTFLLLSGGVVFAYAIVGGALQKRFLMAFSLLGTAITAFILALSFSAFFGGEAIAKRMATLLESDPVTVYYRANRGNQLEYSIRNFVGKYPLGAGLARWGMMRLYFGDEKNPNSPAIWSELQLPSWIFDGGWLMVFLYGGALFATLRYEIWLVRKSKHSELMECSLIVFSLNVGVLALILSYTPFTSQLGMQYWFLSGAIFGAARKSTEYERLRFS